MSEIAEIYKAMRKAQQSAAAQRREEAPNTLRAKGIFFTTHNQGAHLAVETPMGMVDYWPGTGRWSTRHPVQPPVKGFGLRQLLEYIEPEFAK